MFARKNRYRLVPHIIQRGKRKHEMVLKDPKTGKLYDMQDSTTLLDNPLASGANLGDSTEQLMYADRLRDEGRDAEAAAWTWLAQHPRPPHKPVAENITPGDNPHEVVCSPDFLQAMRSTWLVSTLVSTANTSPAVLDALEHWDANIAHPLKITLYGTINLQDHFDRGTALADVIMAHAHAIVRQTVEQQWPHQKDIVRETQKQMEWLVGCRNLLYMLHRYDLAKKLEYDAILFMTKAIQQQDAWNRDHRKEAEERHEYEQAALQAADDMRKEGWHYLSRRQMNTIYADNAKNRLAALAMGRFPFTQGVFVGDVSTWEAGPGLWLTDEGLSRALLLYVYRDAASGRIVAIPVTPARVKELYQRTIT